MESFDELLHKLILLTCFHILLLSLNSHYAEFGWVLAQILSYCKVNLIECDVLINDSMIDMKSLLFSFKLKANIKEPNALFKLYRQTLRLALCNVSTMKSK